MKKRTELSDKIRTLHIHLLHTRPRSIISSESTSSPHFI